MHLSGYLNLEFRVWCLRSRVAHLTSGKGSNGSYPLFCVGACYAASACGQAAAGGEPASCSREDRETRTAAQTARNREKENVSTDMHWDFSFFLARLEQNSPSPSPLPPLFPLSLPPCIPLPHFVSLKCLGNVFLMCCPMHVWSRVTDTFC